MKFNSELYQSASKLITHLPKGRARARKFLFFVSQTNPSWDPWLLKDGDIYRLFYLQGARQSDTWWMEGKIYGAVSKDLRQWQDIGLVLEATHDHPWESGRMLAGCALKENDSYYLFYSAAGQGQEIMNEGIGLATSIDGLHWQRHSTTELLKPSARDRWYGRFKRSVHDVEYDYFQWRDPYVVKDETTGRYYMLICAALQNEVGKYRGCVGLAVADAIDGPYELLPPAAVPIVEGTQESPFYEMERPQVIYRNGQYHLFFSCWTTWLNPKWLEAVDRTQITNSSLYWYVANQITGPYHPVGTTPVVPGSQQSGVYGTNFFPISDRPDEFVAYGWYLQRMTLAISPSLQAVWHGDTVQIVDQIQRFSYK